MMRTLNAHLRQTEAHDGLPFHPGCPICRQTRAIGRLPSDGVVSTRAQAVLAAGVLVVSTGAPITPALAAGEPDQEQQGGAPIAADGGDRRRIPISIRAVTRRISRGGSPAGSPGAGRRR